MQISGKQLWFLVQVLKDSLELQMGYDWSFKYRLEQRKAFHEELLQLLITQNNVDVSEMDVSKLEVLSR